MGKLNALNRAGNVKIVRVWTVQVGIEQTCNIPTPRVMESLGAKLIRSTVANDDDDGNGNDNTGDGDGKLYCQCV